MTQETDGQPFIPVYRPDLSGNEKKYVNECLDSTWISSIGVFLERFEDSFKAATGLRHAIPVSNGTVALHLALHCLDIGPGDEVIVPTFTYIASVNTIAQTGATPIFVDCKSDDWLIDPDDLRRKITPRTKAIMVVHLYGAICDMETICAIAHDHGIAIVEDCAESLGSTLNGKHSGAFGDVGTFSFFGNKTVTTGEGGIVTTQNEKLAARLRLVRGQGQSLTRRYWHVELGFNYRMTNICAAIGLAQFERLPAILARKREIAARYHALFGDLPVTRQKLAPGVDSSNWLVTVLLPHGVDRDRVMQQMLDAGVETRPVFYCAHQMPMYGKGEKFPVSEDIAARGVSLPSFPALTDDEITRVVKALRDSLR